MGEPCDQLRSARAMGSLVVVVVVVELALPDVAGVVVAVDGVAIGAVVVVAGMADWFPAAGTVAEGEPVVLDWANAKLAEPMARMASEEVMKLEVFMRGLSRCCRKQRWRLAAECAD